MLHLELLRGQGSQEVYLELLRGQRPQEVYLELFRGQGPQELPAQELQVHRACQAWATWEMHP